MKQTYQYSPSKAIFLDVDGVLNNIRWAENMEREYGIQIYRDDILEDRAINLLKIIIEETGAVIVVSSDWRKIHVMLGHLRDRLAEYGITIYDVTPTGGPSRGSEIAAWLAQHPGITQYVILDDHYDMEGHGDHLVLTMPTQGLTIADAARCVHRLNEGIEDSADIGVVAKRIREKSKTNHAGGGNGP